MNAHDKWLTASDDTLDAATQLDNECKNVEMLIESSDGDAQEVMAVAIEYADDKLIAKIVRNAITGNLQAADVLALVNLGIVKTAKFNIERAA